EAETGEVVEAAAVGGDYAVAGTQPVAGGAAAGGDLLDHHPGHARLARAGRQFGERGAGQAWIQARARQRARLLAQGRGELQGLSVAAQVQRDPRADRLQALEVAQRGAVVDALAVGGED